MNRSTSDSRAARRSPCASRTTRSTGCARRCKDGWHQLDTADGRVDLKLDEVVYVSETSTSRASGSAARSLVASA